ncbi:MAG TPA: septal ring lytic transglycosylase RlpA family protein [Terracidiphilus sp.]|nr:septal ring lytic transglycosylase RlpA family protein [Terracidiphilus sp.]
MDKLQKKRDFNARFLKGIYTIGVVSILALFVLAAAFFAASTVQADGFFQGNDAPPSTPAIYPEFRMSPHAPHLQPAAEQFYGAPVHKSGYWYRGIASWYGPSFNGRLAADGTVYDMYAMTAATTEFHPRLPLGTKVRVIDSHNGRSVVVRITDRGPLPAGRILDLSYGAARKLAMIEPGIAAVRVQVLSWGRNRYHRPRSG